MDNKKTGLIESEVLINFFIKKLFEDNLIDTDTYVIAKNMSKEGKKHDTKE